MKDYRLSNPIIRRLNKMPRKPMPHNQMRKAVQDRKIDDLLWACLELACVEIKQSGKTETFSGRDLQSLIEAVIKIEKDKRDRGEATNDKETNKKIKEIDSWVRQAR
jgi:hypothetical protein